MRPDVMGYCEEGGVVVLTMSRNDYVELVLALGYAVGAAAARGASVDCYFALVNRLNAGNPNFTPYEVPGADPR